MIHRMGRTIGPFSPERIPNRPLFATLISVRELAIQSITLYSPGWRNKAGNRTQELIPTNFYAARIST